MIKYLNFIFLIICAFPGFTQVINQQYFVDHSTGTVSVIAPTGGGTTDKWYDNLQKYWYYRYRLLNDFMSIGDGAGKSIPAGQVSKICLKAG